MGFPTSTYAAREPLPKPGLRGTESTGKHRGGGPWRFGPSLWSRYLTISTAISLQAPKPTESVGKNPELLPAGFGGTRAYYPCWLLAVPAHPDCFARFKTWCSCKRLSCLESCRLLFLSSFSLLERWCDWKWLRSWGCCPHLEMSDSSQPAGVTKLDKLKNRGQLK